MLLWVALCPPEVLGCQAADLKMQVSNLLPPSRACDALTGGRLALGRRHLYAPLAPRRLQGTVTELQEANEERGGHECRRRRVTERTEVLFVQQEKNQKKHLIVCCPKEKRWTLLRSEERRMQMFGSVNVLSVSACVRVFVCLQDVERA